AIRRTVGPGVEILAVVKADAYGHGAGEVARTLEAAVTGWFGVTSAAEGIALRRDGIQGRILVLAEVDRHELNALAEFNLTGMVHSVEQLRDLEAWARLRQLCPRFHLEFDSGMGRLGLDEARAGEVADLLAGAPHLRLEGLATHFASAEDLASGQTEEQIRRFTALVKGLADRGFRPPFVHMANSAALAYWPQTRGTMVRPGLALYGYLMPPRGGARQAPFQPRPVLSWKARVLTVRQYPAGVPLGYDASYRTDRPMRVGVVAAGYADGLDRRLSNGGMLLAGAKRVRIVGLVSMDVCLVDLSTAPAVVPGDYVTLLGEDGPESLDAAEVAAACRTIPYEILCRVGRRVPRYFV
ncbi:MAG: alanine racemase, partial [Acidobacteria bacterium]|nr:alanine racemase [Acidobacteriota bacterium]